MNDVHARLAALGVKIPEILLPGPGIDLEKWAVIACDQFTQDRNYWEQLRIKTENAPSALNLILPEVYLEDGDISGRSRAIHRAMRNYIDTGVFAPARSCAVYIERSTPFNALRQGLALAIDLDQYDWNPLSRPLIRATEGTVSERLPPRMQIRRDAPLETPHILLLIDDEETALLPGLAEEARKGPPLYQTPLMMNSGSVSGWALDSEKGLCLLAEGLEHLARKAASRYGTNDKVPFLFAVGDGNHSLATAKEVWEEYKAAHKGEPGLANHPGRFALVELENLYDPGLSFRPIHRIIFGADPSELLKTLSGLPGFSGQVLDKTIAPAEFFRMTEEGGKEGNSLGLISRPGNTGKTEDLVFTLIKTRDTGIATARLQPLLDDFVKKQGVSIDYIHGEEELLRLCSDPARKPIGILLPPIEKQGLFKTIAQTGPLPRKSFSMGESEEKRFYLECRKLFG